MRGSARMASLFFALAVVPLALGGWGVYRGWRTTSWPTTDAKILGSDLGRVLTERRQDDRTITDVRHTVAIRYSYMVGGREYLGEGIQPYSYGMQNSAAARDQFERYRPGMTVKVAYDPDDPADAYLEPGPSSVSKLFLGIGVIFMAVGFWLIWIARRSANTRG